MSYTLYNAMLDLLGCLNDVHGGTVTTGGSSNSLVDTQLTEPAGYYTGGTVFFPACGGSELSRYVSGHAANTLTFDAAGSNLGVGDRYFVAGNRFPRYVLKMALNQALQEIGPFVTYTDIATSGSTNEYPVSDDVLAVQISTSGSYPFNWVDHYHWTQPTYSVAGSRKLIFDEGSEPKATGGTIRYFHTEPHSEIKDDSDVITSDVHPNRLKWTAAVYALRWRYQRTRNDEPENLELIGEAKQNIQAAQQSEQLNALKFGEVDLQSAEQMKAAMQQQYPIHRKRTSRLARY